MPDNPAEGDDGVDLNGDQGGVGIGFTADVEDDLGLLDGDQRDHGEGEWTRRDFDPGEGLTEPERELADERNRIRELERARDRVERSARDGDLGGGGGGTSPEDRDAAAIILAAERFGLEASERDEEERAKIKEALAVHSGPVKRPDEYSFYAIVKSQQTAGQSIILNLRVPWEHRDEVFRALETMPFRAQVVMRELTDVQE